MRPDNCALIAYRGVVRRKTFTECLAEGFNCDKVKAHSVCALIQLGAISARDPVL